jgi:chemotaxis protein MotB
MSDDRRQINTDSVEERIWLTVYADMITNLMMFFLMLFGLTRFSAATQKDISKGLEDKFRGKADVEFRAEKVLKDYREEEAASKVTTLMEKQGLDKYTSVEVTEKQIRVTMNIPVLFGSGDSALTSEATNALGGLAKVLSSVPNKVVVEGHTDNVPIAEGKYKSNWELSVARSYSVIEFFVLSRNIDPKRFIAAGFGEYKPVSPNNTVEGRAKNRRIEIVMLR